MSRGIGGIDLIQELLPDWMALGVGLLTQLGDAWFLVLLLAVLYWSMPSSQDDVLLVMVMYVAGLGLYRSLKFVFELPRPEEPLLDPELVPWLIRPLYEATAFASSYGFPSGHATASTIVYGGLAAVLTVATKRRRYLSAAVLVAVVGLSRVALGVHFVVDIVVGTALGGLVVVLTVRGLRSVTDRVSVVLAAAIGTTGFYLFESGADLEAVLAAGIALGLFGGWQLVVLARAVVTRRRPSRALAPLVFRGRLAAVSFLPLLAALELFPVLGEEPFPLGGLAGLGAAGAVVVPIARYSPRVSAAYVSFAFWARTAVGGLRSLLRRGLSRLR